MLECSVHSQAWMFPGCASHPWHTASQNNSEEVSEVLWNTSEYQQNMRSEAPCREEGPAQTAHTGPTPGTPTLCRFCTCPALQPSCTLPGATRNTNEHLHLGCLNLKNVTLIQIQLSCPGPAPWPWSWGHPHSVFFVASQGQMEKLCFQVTVPNRN